MPAETRAERRAAAFQRKREAHNSEAVEDYAELIDDLIAAEGEARIVDIAQHMGVSHGTVAKVVQRLQREGVVRRRPYGALFFLTEEGHAIAALAKRRHRVVLEFLNAIGVPDATAEADAEGIEHHVSPETLEAFERIFAKMTGSRID